MIKYMPNLLCTEGREFNTNTAKSSRVKVLNCGKFPCEKENDFFFSGLGGQDIRTVDLEHSDSHRQIAAHRAFFEI